MGIIMKNSPVEAHHSVGLIECYHGPLCQIYIIITSILPEIKSKLALQMSFKAINNLVGSNGLILTLLLFSAYPYMTDINESSPSINQRSIGMHKAIEKVKRFHVSRQVNDELIIQNDPSTSLIHDLPLNSWVLIFWEKKVGQSGS